MGFFSGRVTFARYRLHGQPPMMFGEEHLDQLAANQAGRQRIASSDGIEIGWSAGDHILDVKFDLAKNIINDMLHIAMRIDQQKLPSDLLKAYYAIDLQALSANNPSGHASAKQKREARESARERLEDEARDGRYLKRKLIPVVWDRLSNELLFGVTSLAQVDRLLTLWQQTFGVGFEAITAGRQAYRMSEVREQTRSVDDASPSVFVPGISPQDVAWVLDETSRDFLGNEFLLWLWYTLEVEGDAIPLSDGTEAVVMMARTLVLECPRAMTGHETITCEGPTRLPEAKKAVQSGKMPRKAGLTLVRHNEQYEFTLHAETLAIGSAKMPPIEESDARVALEERATQIRHLTESVDLLFDAFVAQRLADEWPETLAKIQKWLQGGDRRQSAMMG
ncbi:hypothetical protein [Tuwongella immobilis]|uniref:Recombination-associated protein RdgC n=1 Tax=Tuwongella immobilis TaxID=692036 RepID=A0A6C2YPY7_9BACT|nr:hypothetical protein [Tuwongella immobilis]VIP03454.1 Uncharacterized protein OS=Singulisphaera acidiphila (strain ATCC BAA-1392 / DSM 18658 / VKM B-2454 / MOB10) GN=Sinac_0973 PE=4 SV=1 [Tuwongella immobilis]VTS04280.1 Uncharacterized protein OS=Singulisphaera acidiphila (strain ATCC BAA-1392 / DSM 18658 / VKM B-2454 / MOB10) GN=Sinac_0973 PE=4 SV=1 [Tuwongella immobilis]